MGFPAITEAIPSINEPLIDRDRKPSVVWYPFIKRIVGFTNGLANGELIVDGAISARTIAAGAVTATAIAADAVTATHLAADSITAGNASIADAAVDTLQIAGNAVTQAVSTYAGTQSELSSTSYTTITSTSMTTSATQPILVAGSLTAGGAYDSGGSGDYYYEGTYWTNNTASSYISLQAKVGSTTSDVIESITVHAGETSRIAFQFLFSGISAATHTVAITAKKESGYDNVAIRDTAFFALETKR
jgi:hypothetical protein